MTAILDQKHYIEELNRHLSGTVTDLQAKMDSLEKTNSKLVEEVRRALCVQLWDCVRTGLILFNISLCVCVCFLLFFSWQLPQTESTLYGKNRNSWKRRTRRSCSPAREKRRCGGGGKCLGLTAAEAPPDFKKEWKMPCFYFSGSASGQPGRAGDIQTD